jgi:hypothetical protein
MTVARHLPRATPLLAIALELSGCGWTDLDAVDPGAPSPAPDAEVLDVRPHPRDAAPAPVDATGAKDASTADASPDGEASSLPCTGDQTTVYDWTFDSTVEGWALDLDKGVTASFTWTGSTGYPSLGAVEVQIIPAQNDGGAPNGGWIQYAHAFGDLSGRTVSAWVWLESGPSPYLQVFAQTGSQYAWGDNGTLRLRPRTWTCVSLPISTPYYNQPGYDPTDVVTVGFLFLATASFAVYVDTVRIY